MTCCDKPAHKRQTCEIDVCRCVLGSETRQKQPQPDEREEEESLFSTGSCLLLLPDTNIRGILSFAYFILGAWFKLCSAITANQTLEKNLYRHLNE